MFFIELTVLAIACPSLLSIFWSTVTLGISPMPTSRQVKREVLALGVTLLQAATAVEDAMGVRFAGGNSTGAKPLPGLAK